MIEALTPALEPSYERFVAGRPDGLLYDSLAYRDLLVEQLGCRAEYLVAVEGGEVRGALPVMWAERDGARVANSLPFYGSHGGPLADGHAAREALLAAWAERARDPGTAAATLVENPFAAPLAAVPHDLLDERISQASSLPAVVEPSARRNVRKAERIGVEVAIDPAAIGDLCRLHRENIAAIGGRAKRPGFFEAIARHFVAGRDYDVYAARLDGRFAAALLVFWFGRTAEYFTPAVDPRHRSDQPLAAILARALEDAAARGMQRFNWGGTWHSQHGVYRFKRKWGARDARYRYFVALNDRSLLDCSPDELRDRFGDFYVVPFSALRSKEVIR